ncbi:GMC oxidoreductase [Streptomyces shenzhenensis]|nr:GMC oxidoreductase [Streptomyces shenzhenensis]
MADASVLPGCPEVNPQLTIMAVALAVTESYLDRDLSTRARTEA